MYALREREPGLILDPGEDTVEVYLPAGRWVHLWSGRTVLRRVASTRGWT